MAFFAKAAVRYEGVNILLFSGCKENVCRNKKQRGGDDDD
jgi:hypothetical protein